MSVETLTTSIGRMHDIEPYVEPSTLVVDFNNPQAIAACLLDSGEYEGYAHDPSFTEIDVSMLALEDAQAIVDKRNRLLKSRDYMLPILEATIAQIGRKRVWDETVYLCSITPVDAERKVS